MKPMLSKRAQNAIMRIGKIDVSQSTNTKRDTICGYNPYNSWLWADFFAAESKNDIIRAFQQAKNSGHLHNVGQGTLDEILEFHKLLNKVWG